MNPRWLLATLALLFAAPAIAQEKKELRWGTDPTGGGPYIYKYDPNGPYVGFEVEFAEYLAKKLGRAIPRRPRATGRSREGCRPVRYLATPADRLAQLRALRTRFDAAPVRRPLPHLPLTPGGLPDQAILDRLRAARNDPDLTINE